ncbi:hypothetical protein [Hydrogenophaga sp. PAMC20947]|nr:hypothetical protein [Hydrogenophaga sp. PAMC20947]
MKKILTTSLPGVTTFCGLFRGVGSSGPTTAPAQAWHTDIKGI